MHDSMGLMKQMYKQSLLSVLTRGVVNAGRRGKGAGSGRRRDIPMRCATRLATREDIETALHEQRPPHDPLEVFQRSAKGLKVPSMYIQAARSEYGELWEYSSARE